MTKEFRCRFAPSPTGLQHVGGIRSAIYGWLMARRYNGKVALRIEDTDLERKVPGAVEFLLNEFKWLGLDYDEGPTTEELAKIGEHAEGIGGPYGPYIQTLKLPRYKEVAEELVAKGVCYRCDCTPEMLERERHEQQARKEPPGYSGYCRDRKVPADKPHVIRLRMPENKPITLNDPIHGKVVWDNASLRDPVLLKSDGNPTYHLAVVVDDRDMKISHVMRGIEWMPSAPIHLLLSEYLGWEPPVYIHMPVVLGPDGKKLSKRTGAPTTKELREQGYLPEAVFNYITLVGWAPGKGSNQEIFTREELIAQFSIEGLNPANGSYDPKKLEWMNGMYIRALSPSEFAKRGEPYLTAAGIKVDPRWARIAPHVQERIRNMQEIAPMVDFIFADKITPNVEEMFQKGIGKPEALTILQKATEAFSGITEFAHDQLEAAMRGLAEQMGFKPGPTFGVVRVAVTGKKVTPPLFESLAVLGKDVVLARLKAAEGLLKAVA